jgi:hypothetical protein
VIPDASFVYGSFLLLYNGTIVKTIGNGNSKERCDDFQFNFSPLGKEKKKRERPDLLLCWVLGSLFFLFLSQGESLRPPLATQIHTNSPLISVQSAPPR